MKNEPIIAYNHLQEEQEEGAGQDMSEHSHAISKWHWKALLNPFAIAIEIAAIAVMAFFMIEEIFH